MFYLAWRNITRRLGSSVLTAFIAFMAVLALTASMIVVTSLEDGVRLSRERLGADIMVVAGRRLGQCLGGALLRRAGERVSAGVGRCTDCP